MKIYSISMPVHAGTTVYVEADSPEEAIQKANVFEGMTISICHRCAKEVDGPTIGCTENFADNAVIVDDPEWIKEARRWMSDNS